MSNPINDFIMRLRATETRPCVLCKKDSSNWGLLIVTDPKIVPANKKGHFPCYAYTICHDHDMNSLSPEALKSAIFAAIAIGSVENINTPKELTTCEPRS